jgi:ElaB/YqjD/DUF883 family membrane-anchored ribosome-binding protein
MERNDERGDANEFSGSGSEPKRDTGFDFAGSSEGIRDRARSALDSAGDRLADAGTTARDKLGTAKEKLASALEAGAGRLRDRTGAAALAGATSEESASLRGDGRVSQVSDRVAGGMQATADWIRDADLDGIKSGIERQVRDHPGRTLLIAAGLGYLIGRAFRRDL